MAAARVAVDDEDGGFGDVLLLIWRWPLHGIWIGVDEMEPPAPHTSAHMSACARMTRRLALWLGSAAPPT